MSLRTSLLRSTRVLAAPRASSSRIAAAAPRFARSYASDENSQGSSKAKDRAAVGVSFSPAEGYVFSRALRSSRMSSQMKTTIPKQLNVDD